MNDVLINDEGIVSDVNDIADNLIGNSTRDTIGRSLAALSPPSYKIWSFVASSSSLSACTSLEFPRTTTETGNTLETATKSVTFSDTITIFDFALQRQRENAKLALEQRQAVAKSQAYDNNGFRVIRATDGLSEWIDTETASLGNTFRVYPGVLIMDEVERCSWQCSKQLEVIFYHLLAERLPLFPSEAFALLGMRSSQTEGRHYSSKQQANSLKSKNARDTCCRL
ncbi:MAG: hypothetical protein AB1589_19265 [Cyanobacteriota bacterium]